MTFLESVEYEKGIRNGVGMAHAELERLAGLVEEKHQAIARVRELHKAEQAWANSYKCIECSPNSCGCCSYVEYPCPTIQALDGEQ